MIQGSGCRKQNEAANLLTLRRWFQQTQREFIETYLLDATGPPIISVATLSGVENGTQSNLAPLLAALSEHLHVDADVFAQDPDIFAKNIDLFFRAPPVARSGTRRLPSR